MENKDVFRMFIFKSYGVKRFLRMCIKKKCKTFFLCFGVIFLYSFLSAEIPLYWWEPDDGITGITNFGDTLSQVLVERIIEKKVQKASRFTEKRKFLAVGSLLHFARDGDVIWGTGINGKHPFPKDYHFKNLDVRSVRGPLTNSFLKSLGVANVPEIYGDPILLFPLFFPEFWVNPKRDYIILPHISEGELFKDKKNVVLATEPWDQIVKKVTESRFVIASSLHGVILAEAFGISARLLRVTNNEPLFKYADYYRGTGRENFRCAMSVEEALQMGGEELPVCDLEALIQSFPIELFE